MGVFTNWTDWCLMIKLISVHFIFFVVYFIFWAKSIQPPKKRWDLVKMWLLKEDIPGCRFSLPGRVGSPNSIRPPQRPWDVLCMLFPCSLPFLSFLHHCPVQQKLPQNTSLNKWQQHFSKKLKIVFFIRFYKKPELTSFHLICLI